MRIELRDAEIRRVRIDLTTSAGVEFFLEASQEGFEFFVTKSSSGQAHDKPILVSTDEIWNLIADKDGGRVKLKDRAVVKRALKKTPR